MHLQIILPVKRPKLKTRKLLAISLAFIVGLSMGVGLFYLPNASKPAWMPRDARYDIGYAWSYIQSLFKPGISSSGQQDNGSEAVQFNSTLASLVSDRAALSQEYAIFAPQHGISLSTEWTMSVTVVSDTGSGVVGTLTISWDGQSVNVSPGIASGPGTRYDIVVKNSSGMALLADFESGDFLKGSADFMYALASGNLKWTAS